MDLYHSKALSRGLYTMIILRNLCNNTALVGTHRAVRNQRSTEETAERIGDP